jgi:hypothetical protein
MTKSKLLQESAAFWSGMVSQEFLSIAHHLATIQEYHPEQFRLVAKNLGIGVRKAYYLASISRKFELLAVEPKRLEKIGWTKLRIISDHVDLTNFKAVLELAEQSTAHELALIAKGKYPLPGTRCVILYLEPDQHDVFADALKANGAVQTANGLANKEEALIRALSGSRATPG